MGPPIAQLTPEQQKQLEALQQAEMQRQLQRQQVLLRLCRVQWPLQSSQLPLQFPDCLHAWHVPCSGPPGPSLHNAELISEKQETFLP